jgi:FKBP-type peptidyl-prolyl cis-trans isomerase 2
MAVGEDKRGEIPAAEAFGDESSLPTLDMLKKEFPPEEKLTLGRVFTAKSPGKDAVRFRIVSVDGELVKVRLLHELSDRDIEFRVKILGIQPPRSRRNVLQPPPLPAAALGIDTDSIKLVTSDDKAD